MHDTINGETFFMVSIIEFFGAFAHYKTLKKHL